MVVGMKHFHHGCYEYRKLFPHVRSQFLILLVYVSAVPLCVLNILIRLCILKKIRDQQTRLGDVDPEQQPLLGQANADVAPTTVTLTLAAIRPLYALVFGLMLGASVIHRSQFGTMLTATVAYIAFVAMSSQVSQAGLVLRGEAGWGAKKGAFITAVTFVVVTPLGVWTGMGMVRMMHGWDERVMNAGLHLISSGIFLHVYIELLHEKAWRKDNKLGRGERVVLVEMAQCFVVWVVILQYTVYMLSSGGCAS